LPGTNTLAITENKNYSRNKFSDTGPWLDKKKNKITMLYNLKVFDIVATSSTKKCT